MAIRNGAVPGLDCKSEPVPALSLGRGENLLALPLHSAAP